MDRLQMDGLLRVFYFLTDKYLHAGLEVQYTAKVMRGLIWG